MPPQAQLFPFVPRLRSPRAPELALLLAASLCQAPGALAARTTSYVASWFVPAMYAHEGDCRALEPIPEPGRSPIDTMYRGFLRQMGKTEAEIAELMKTLDGAQDSPI